MVMRTGHLNLVAVTMIVYGCNYEPQKIAPQTDPPPPTIMLPAPETGESVTLSRCTRDPNDTHSGLPVCEIYRDGFVTESATSLTLIVSAIPGNRKCCLTAEVQDGGSYQTCYVTSKRRCEAGFSKVPS